jgi:hypothetical protein
VEMKCRCFLSTRRTLYAFFQGPQSRQEATPGLSNGWIDMRSVSESSLIPSGSACSAIRKATGTAMGRPIGAYSAPQDEGTPVRSRLREFLRQSLHEGAK